MKKVLIILGLISIIASSCDEDELLNPENRNQLNAENFWLNQSDAEAGIYSVYSALQFNGVLGGGATVTYAILSEAGRVGNVNRDPERLQFDDALVNSTNAQVLGIWEDCYKIVFRANQVIDNVPSIEMDEIAKKEILGEAHFLRGLAMFWISTMYNEGNVPYPLIAPDNLEEARFSIEERSFVTNQIEQDLLTAQTNLEDRLNWTSEGLEGRATYGAVTAILGKFYLYEEKFSSAAEEFKKVIDLGEYSLVPNIGDNFTEEGEFNSESIFEVQFFANIENGGNFGDGEGSQPNESTLRPVLWTRGNGGFGFMFATHFISSLYRNEVIDPNLPINQAPEVIFDEGYDPNLTDEDNEDNIIEVPRLRSHRSQASIAYEEDGTIYYNNSTKAAFTRVFSRAQVRKFSNASTVASEPRNSGINERVIRLADVYLMYAEALLREQGDGALTEALGYINQVRQRSGLLSLEELFNGVTIPPVIQSTFPDLDVRPLNEETEDLEEEQIEISSELLAIMNELQALNELPELTEAQMIRRSEILLRIPEIEERIPEIEERIPEIAMEIAQIEMDIDTMVPELPAILKIEPQALNATNVLGHLFNKERPAEFAWEGRAILWQDLKRRPSEIGTGVERIEQLGAVLYQSVTLDVQPFETDPMFIENSLQDFRFRKVNFDESDFYFPIPAQEILQNPDLDGN